MSATRFWNKWVEATGSMPRSLALALGVGLLLLAATLDWATGPEAASAIFYVVPILWLTWQRGRAVGLATALASGAIWLGVLLKTRAGYPTLFIPCWNAGVRTVTFCLVSTLLTEVLERKRVEQRLRRTNHYLEQQTGILQSILDSMGDGVVVADAAGQLLHMNPAASRVLRLPPGRRDVVAWLESEEGRTPLRGGTGSGHQTPLLRALRGETVEEEEVMLQSRDFPDGVWLLVNGRPLQDNLRQLAGGVMVFADITGRKALERQIAAASDREQRRLGEDLHDGLCQHLVSTAFAARNHASKLVARSAPEAKDATRIADLLSESIAQARDVARGLYLVSLEEGGLASALEELSLQVRARSEPACEFVEKTPVPMLEQSVVTNLFRIAQEAVNNALKHAQASQVTIRLSAEAQWVRLQVEDDGMGFQAGTSVGRTGHAAADSRPRFDGSAGAAAAVAVQQSTPVAPAGMGLRMMQYRARMVGAVLEIGPRPGGGTLVTCLLPIGDVPRKAQL